jgi:hypothetical protein
MTHYLYAKPAFTTQMVAIHLGLKLGRELSFTEGNEDEDGCITVTDRVDVQVGADYLCVNAWADATTFKTWPTRRKIALVYADVHDALFEFPGPRP